MKIIDAVITKTPNNSVISIIILLGELLTASFTILLLSDGIENHPAMISNGIKVNSSRLNITEIEAITPEQTAKPRDRFLIAD